MVIPVYCGKGTRSCERETVAVLRVVPGSLPANGFVNCVLRYWVFPPRAAIAFSRSERGIELSWVPLFVGSLCTLLPTYATSRPMLQGRSTLNPAIHWSEYGITKSGLRNEMLVPFPVASPSALPKGCTKPSG